MKIFDTHTHDYFSDFENDREQMMKDDFDHGVIWKVQIGCDEITSQKAIQLAQHYDFCKATVGLHPCNVCEPRESKEYNGKEKEECGTQEELFAWFESVLQKYPKKIVGIGETGFDFYHHDFPEMREEQAKSFLKHCQLAKKYEKTLIIHTRNARNETLLFLNKNNAHLPKKGIVHCFSEDANFAESITEEYGYMLGIGGVATYKKAENVREAIKKTPIAYIITETDAPYLAPQSVRGKRNQSKNIKEIIACIAEIKNIEQEYCADILFENALRTFGIE